MDPALVDLIADGDATDIVAVVVRLSPDETPPPGLRIVARFGQIATARAARAALLALYDSPAILSIKGPRQYAGEPAAVSTLATAGLEQGADKQRRPADLLETGRGVLVAVIDWGIDFAHPDFRHADGRTRFRAIWDQRATGDTAPYGYGRLHLAPEIDQALASPDPFAALDCYPNRTGAVAHGTHVLGIAAGNGAAGGPSGVAPAADLFFAHLGPGVGDLGNSVDILEAIDLAVRIAGEDPLVINMSLGRIAGPHDGTLLLEQAIDWLLLARPGTAVVQSTGNYFAKRAHTEGRLREDHIARLPFDIPRQGPSGTTVELWYKGSDAFVAHVTAPGGATATAARGATADLRDASGALLATLHHRAFDPQNGDHLIALSLPPMAPAGAWSLDVTGVDVVDGRWHAWIERNAQCPECQGRFRSGTSRVTTGSVCNAQRTISTGAYDASNPQKALAPFSSVGPTRDGRPKPLLVAPGVRELSVRSRSDARSRPGYVRMSGTSMAAPHVAGTVALMFEAAGPQPIVPLRRALFASLEPPPRAATADHGRWGYGLLNVTAAVAAARQLTRIIKPATASLLPLGETHAAV